MQIANSVFNKGKSSIPLFNNPEVLSSAFDKAKMFAKTFSRNSNSWDFWQIANIVLNKGKSAIPPLFNSPEMSSEPEKAKVFAKSFPGGQ